MPAPKKTLTYKKAGVDIRKADRFVSRIAPLAKSTATRGLLGSIGGFGGAFLLPKGLRDPVIVSSTDGVGTKVLLAGMRKVYDTVGIDLVAMCVNDLITTGARPLFFLDYLAVPKLKIDQSVELLRGISKGCRQAGCVLIGGETAEMPGLYRGDDFDLAGFSVGVVEKKKMIDGKSIKTGDLLVGLKSTGLHSNGYSLARKCFNAAEIKSELGNILLKPTRIYVKPILNLISKVNVKGMAHITGGGFYGNIPRVFPRKAVFDVHIDRKSWKAPEIFDIISRRANLSRREMFSTFNMGIGMVLVVDPASAKSLEKILKRHKMPHVFIGHISKGRGKVIL